MLEKTKKVFTKKNIRKFVFLNIGLVFISVGITFFCAPNHFAMGGTSGLSVILTQLVSWLNVGSAMFIINVLLLIVGFVFLGKQVMGFTVYSSIAISVFISILQKIFPLSQPITGETMLELMYAVALPAVGSAIAFNLGASTGGTDIVAMILSKYGKIEIGKALLCSDVLITILACVVFGLKIGLYSLLGLLIKSFLIDSIIEAFNKRKLLTIISDKSEEIKNYIITNVNRGATIHHAQGAYSHDEKQVITTIVSNRQAVMIRNQIKEIDPKAFITIVNTSETIGKGFRRI